jgi:drug/metabolite transporter (DMT)-like permease
MAVESRNYTSQHQGGALAAIALGSAVWGLTWYPLRMLAGYGVSGTLASSLTGLAACAVLTLVGGPRLWRMPASPLLAVLTLAAGVTNVGFTWGVIHGAVMRVLLLFYLSPAWTALLAQPLLGERLSWRGGALVLLSLCGAGLMLWSPALGLPLPATPAEWAGLVAGIGFAVNNVLTLRIVRVLPGVAPRQRTLLVFGGSALLGLAAACAEAALQGAAHASPLAAVREPGPAAVLVLALGVVLAFNNVIVQHGLARVAANRAAIVMLLEIVVTAVSAWLWAGEVPGPREIAGGACIVAAALLAATLRHPDPKPPAGHPREPGERPKGKQAMV